MLSLVTALCCKNINFNYNNNKHILSLCALDLHPSAESPHSQVVNIIKKRKELFNQILFTYLTTQVNITLTENCPTVWQFLCSVGCVDVSQSFQLFRVMGIGRM
jgi:hypothetical protein